eukprot:4205796-Prymnesium_polylepis.1
MKALEAKYSRGEQNREGGRESKRAGHHPQHSQPHRMILAPRPPGGWRPASLFCVVASCAVLALAIHPLGAPLAEKSLCPWTAASSKVYKRTTRAMYTSALASVANDATTDGCECAGKATWLDFAHCAVALSLTLDYPHEYTGVRFWFCNHRASSHLAPKAYATVDDVAAALNELNPILFENWEGGSPSMYTFTALQHGAVWGFRLTNASVKLGPTCNLFPGTYAHMACFHAFGHAMWYTLVPEARTSP